MDFRNTIGVFWLCLFFGQFCLAQDNSIDSTSTDFRRFYKIGDHQQVFIPLGKIAFADSVIHFNPGNPAAHKPFNKPENSLGEPDFTTYRTDSPKYVSIGCHGSLTVKFTDNGFIDIPGPDLVFFEVGPSIEPFRLEISTDGHKWYKLGNVSGGKSHVDIAQFIHPTSTRQIYYYIRITDLKHFCKGPTPGSDIDAIGAIGAVIKLSLDAAVLFDTDKYSLRQTAKDRLLSLAQKATHIPKAEFIIKGYTDSDGSNEYNIKLGKNRATSVADYLKKLLNGLGDYTYTIETYGENQPISDNSTPEGKQQNRRVEIIVIPSEEFYKSPQ